MAYGLESIHRRCSTWDALKYNDGPSLIHICTYAHPGKVGVASSILIKIVKGWTPMKNRHH